MTTTFESREKGFENKYAHDLEQAFKAKVRAFRLLGLWVAEKMQLKDDKAAEYAESLVDATLESSAVEKVVEKIVADCRAVELEVQSEEVVKELQKYMELAKQAG